MKIIRDNVCYVQYNDLAVLYGSDELIPVGVFMQAYGRESFAINEKNRYQFMKFDKPEDIEYFRNISWMLNYDDVKDLDNDSLVEVANSVQDGLKSSNMLREKKEMLEYLYCSIGDFYMFKNGNLEFLLPEGIEYPDGYPNIIYSEAVVVDEDKGIKKFIKSLLGGKK